MKTFTLLYSSDFEGGDDDRHQYRSGKSWSSERRAFSLLAFVCSSWRHALTGWPESPTRRWCRHQLKKLTEREYTHCLFTTCTCIYELDLYSKLHSPYIVFDAHVLDK